EAPQASKRLFLRFKQQARLRRRHRSQLRVAQGNASSATGGPDGSDGTDQRRKRYGERAHRARDPREKCAQPPRAGEIKLRRGTCDPFRKRVLWTYERRVYRRVQG